MAVPSNGLLGTSPRKLALERRAGRYRAPPRLLATCWVFWFQEPELVGKDGLAPRAWRKLGKHSVLPGFGASQTFTATGGSGLGYVWSFRQNASGGILTASGDYQAGPVGGVTDVLQVVDSFANRSTATVNVSRQATTVSATGPLAKSVGCATSGGAALPWLGGALLLLLGWRSLRVRRPRLP